MRLGDALQRGAVFLRHSGSPSARLDAEVLLAHTLRLRRVELYLRLERPLTDPEEREYEALLQRRARREPVSYLVGQKEFFGLTFTVDRRVMIPRPETEILVERALEAAEAWRGRDLHIADIGTGSGCIAIALAVRLPWAGLYGTDLSAEALQVAEENCRQSGVGDRVTLLQGDLCESLPQPVDLLVSNPPYTVWSDLPAGITDYEPRLALDGGAAGLALYRRLVPQLARSVRPGGQVFLEVGEGQAEAVVGLAREHLPGAPTRIWPDYGGLERVVQIGPLGLGGPSAKGNGAN